MAAPSHILEQVSALALSDGRTDFKLLVAHDGKLVRISIPTAGIWVMRADEDGSMMDREMDVCRAHFVKLTHDEIEQGAGAIYANLRDLAEEMISNTEETK